MPGKTQVVDGPRLVRAPPVSDPGSSEADPSIRRPRGWPLPGRNIPIRRQPTWEPTPNGARGHGINIVAATQIGTGVRTDSRPKSYNILTINIISHHDGTWHNASSLTGTICHPKMKPGPPLGPGNGRPVDVATPHVAGSKAPGFRNWPFQRPDNSKLCLPPSDGEHPCSPRPPIPSCQ
jgi:hypothetical protein